MNNIAEISEVFRQSYEFLGGELEKKFLGVQTNYISSIGGVWILNGMALCHLVFVEKHDNESFQTTCTC